VVVVTVDMFTRETHGYRPYMTNETESDAAPTAAEESNAARPIKQMLAWAMGDRDMEAKALADETAATTGLTQEEALDAAKAAVAEAHSDTGIADPDVQPNSDVARPSDVVEATKEL
jgi:hypothetical protein